MFGRSRQENFFKYLREQYALDALVEREIVPDDPLREVPNPARRDIDNKLRQARSELAGEVRGNLVWGAFCRIGCETVPDAKTLIRLSQTLAGDTLKKILERLVGVAR